MVSGLGLCFVSDGGSGACACEEEVWVSGEARCMIGRGVESRQRREGVRRSRCARSGCTLPHTPLRRGRRRVIVIVDALTRGRRHRRCCAPTPTHAIFHQATQTTPPSLPLPSIPNRDEPIKQPNLHQSERGVPPRGGVQRRM